MQTDGMATAGSRLDRHWETVLRWHPYALLAVSLLLTVVGPNLTSGRAEQLAVVVAVAAALAVQLWWERSGRTRPVTYFVARWAISTLLTALNPFFSFYASTGYIDNSVLLHGRRRRLAGGFAHSLPIASAQAGGLPFDSPGRWIMFLGLLLANNALVTLISYFVVHEEERSRARAATIAELERANTALRQALDENAGLQAQLLARAREAGIAEERTRLAAEIHDTLAQGLTGIITQLQAGARTADPVAARGHLDSATDLARHSLGEARRSVRNLAPLILTRQGLPEALRDTLAGWAERHRTRTELTVTGKTRDLPGDLPTTILRITREALANAAEHAGATRVGVTLSYMDGEITLDIRDDGCGFDPHHPPPRTRTGGFGLTGMRSRAESAAGTLTVESEPGHGTAVSIRLPTP